MSNAWITLWKKWDVDLGGSIDGPANIHDINQKTHAGGGSHHLTFQGIRKIQKAGLHSHIITFLGAQGLQAPDKLVDFFLAHRLRDVGFNVEEFEGQEVSSSLKDLAKVQDAYRYFLHQIMRRIAQAPDQFACRKVEVVRELIARPHQHPMPDGKGYIASPQRLAAAISVPSW